MPRQKTRTLQQSASSAGERHLSDIDSIMDLWLDEVGPGGWYTASEELDARITRDYRGLWDTALAGGLRGWQQSAKGTLALLILTDQLPRNMFRGTARAFASDAAARRIAIAAIGREQDVQIDVPARQFFYLPLMHSEVIADQERCLRLLLMRMPGSVQIEHAVKHRDVIRRFGRFPSRNAAMGRRDTDAELAYRAAGGYMG